MSTRARLNRNLPRGYFADAPTALAPSEIVAPGKTPTTDSANDAHAVAEKRAQFAGPTTGKLIAGSGEPGVIGDTARHMPTPAGYSSPVGLDISPEFGVNESARVTAGGGPSSPPDCPEPKEHPKPSRCRHCSKPGYYVRTRYFDTEKAHVWECTNPRCHIFGLIWHTSEPWVNPRSVEIAQQLRAARIISGAY